MRRTRCSVLVLAGVLALALVAACGGDRGAERPPGTTPSLTVPSTTAPQVTRIDLARVEGVSLDLTAMRIGTRPRTPWIDGQVLHHGTVDMPVAPSHRNPEAVPLVFAFGGGALRYDDPNGAPGARLDVLRADGTISHSAPATPPVLSWDGRQVAWWEQAAHAVLLGDVTTGRLEELPARGPWGFWTQRHPGSPWSVAVVGWLEHDLLVRGPGSDGGYWRTSDRKVPAWTAQRFSGLSREAGIALVEDFPYTDPTKADANCLSAVDLESSVPLWRHCYQRGDQPYPALEPVFSPDGKRLAVASISITTGEPGYELVLDAATGDVLARFDLGRYEGDEWGFATELTTPWFEDDDHLLAVVDQRRHDVAGAPTATTDEAIVRCGVPGGCELATPVVTHQGDGPRPYRLR